MYVDRTDSGGMTNTTVEGGDVILPSDGLQLDSLDLVVFLDHNLIEVSLSLLMCHSIHQSTYAMCSAC